MANSLSQRATSMTGQAGSWRDRASVCPPLLETRVSTALSDEIGISEAPAGITVSAANGRVTLMGASSSGNLRAKAEKVAFRVAGGCAIDNHISSLPTRGAF